MITKTQPSFYELLIKCKCHLKSRLCGHRNVVMRVAVVDRLVVWLPCMVIFCKNSLIIASQILKATVSCLAMSCHDLL